MIEMHIIFFIIKHYWLFSIKSTLSVNSTWCGFKVKYSGNPFSHFNRAKLIRMSVDGEESDEISTSESETEDI